ncbi:MAG: carbohydrate ABC transporter permease [Brevinema sp.]
MKKIKQKKGENATAWIMLAPFFIIFVLFILQPLVGALIISFHTGPFNNMTFTGISNYFRLFQDPLVFRTLSNTILFVLISTPIYLGMAVLFALWAQYPSGISTMLRISFYIPTVLVLTIMTTLWILMFRQELGLWASLTEGTLLNSWRWFYDVNLARWTIVLSTLWWTVGGNMLIIITILRSIPQDIFEAAELDGVNASQKFFYITLPQLLPTLGVLSVLQVIGSFKLFGQPLMLTGGGPDHMTRSIVQYIYDLGFGSRNPGYAAAISVLLMLFLMMLTLIQTKISFRKQS